MEKKMETIGIIGIWLHRDITPNHGESNGKDNGQ